MTTTPRNVQAGLRADQSSLVIEKASPWLLSHFGSYAAEVGEMAVASGRFQQSLLQLTSRQFHLIGLSLALLRRLTDPKVDVSELGELLASVPGKEVIERIYGRTPRGLLRSLEKLPNHAALRPGAYVNLINLLEEPRAAKVLFYAESISFNTIALLTRLEPALRTPRLIELLKVPRAAVIVEFLIEAILRNRSGVSRQAVLASLGSVGTAEGLEKWFCGWIEKAEFPPPPWNGNDFCIPLRTMLEMRQTARLMRNCLQAKVVSVISGASYYYLRRGDPLSVVELVNDRLAGWMVSEMKGMENQCLPLRLASRIRDEFKAAGIGSMPRFERVPRGLNPYYWLVADFHWPQG